MRNQVRFQDTVDSDEPLDGVVPFLFVLNRVYERDEGFVGRLGNLRLRAKFWQPLA